MKKNAAWPALLLLAGSAGAADLGSCTFHEPITVRIVTYETRAALAEKYRGLLSVSRRLELSRREALVLGFATRRGDVHTLHVLEADWERRESTLAVLGHELLHAFCGGWHESVL